MGVHAVPAPSGGPTLTIRGRTYPVLLPKLADPRLHLAATITSLQVIGQLGFHFRLSLAQIAVALDALGRRRPQDRGRHFHFRNRHQRSIDEHEER